MTVLDDVVLDSLLKEAAEGFTIPTSGADDILQRARPAGDGGAGGWDRPGDPDPVDTAPDDDVPAWRRLRATVDTHRLLSAAAVVLLVAAIGGATVLFGSNGAKPPATTAAPLLHAATAPKAAAGTSPGSTSFGVNGTVTTPVAGPAPTGAPSTGGTALGGATGTGSSAAIPSTPPTTTPALSPGTVGQSARIEQTGSLDLVVGKGKLASTITKLTFLATAYNGFVANSQSQSGAGNGASGSVTLQVPVASFSAVLKSAQSLGRTAQLTTKATDVTGQYVDLQAQITALQASRQQYLTIMAKATTVGDVLAVQAQLDTLQSQIQQLQGQLQVLGSETSYSTLTVSVSESFIQHHRPPPHPESGIAKAWHDSVHGFVDGVDGLVGVGGPVLFALLCAAVLLVAGRLSWRRYQRHRL